MYVSLYCSCVRLNPSHNSTWCLMVTADSTLLANMTGITSNFYGHVILTSDSYRSIAYLATQITTPVDLGSGTPPPLGTGTTPVDLGSGTPPSLVSVLASNSDDISLL